MGTAARGFQAAKNNIVIYASVSCFGIGYFGKAIVSYLNRACLMIYRRDREFIFVGQQNIVRYGEVLVIMLFSLFYVFASLHSHDCETGSLALICNASNDVSTGMVALLNLPCSYNWCSRYNGRWCASLSRSQTYKHNLFPKISPLIRPQSIENCRID